MTKVERYCQAVDVEWSGAALAGIVAGLERHRLATGGDLLKTRTRGVAAGRPRLDLLRHRSRTAGRDWPARPELTGPAALGLIRQTWRQLTPLCEWLVEHVGAVKSCAG